MLTLDPNQSMLLVIDFQSRLMPAIEQGEMILKNAGRLIAAAAILGVPLLHTEQNARGLGGTVPGLTPEDDLPFPKMTFDAVREPGFLARIPADCSVVVAGCETHVCVLQTVLGLIGAGRKVCVIRDAVGSRTPENKEAALARMQRHGAEIATTEMVIFEWLGSAEHPRFREALALVK